MFEFRIPGDDTPFQVGKILCIGRNYARHAAEMGSSTPTAPMVFLKPSTALVATGESVVIPHMSTSVHHEVELVAVIGRTCRHVSVDAALRHIAGYAVGLDMTARDLQGEAKQSRAPWSVSKGFDTFAPLGPVVRATRIPDPQNLEIQLLVNDELRQSGHTSDMIFSVAELISWCSKVFTLERGDLLYTGTPEGVGPVAEGDDLLARIAGLEELRVSVRSEHTTSD